LRQQCRLLLSPVRLARWQLPESELWRAAWGCWVLVALLLLAVARARRAEPVGPVEVSCLELPEA